MANIELAAASFFLHSLVATPIIVALSLGHKTFPFFANQTIRWIAEHRPDTPPYLPPLYFLTILRMGITPTEAEPTSPGRQSRSGGRSRNCKLQVFVPTQ